MNYRALKNWGKDKRTLILPQDSFDTEKRPTLNSGDISLIKARECADGKSCVQIENNGNTSICIYMGAYPGVSMGGEPGLKALTCLHPKAPVHLEVASLIAFCPTDMKACINRGTPCEHLQNVLTPEQVSGPHYHVVCGPM
jgi:hypothetical protein